MRVHSQSIWSGAKSCSISSFRGMSECFSASCSTSCIALCLPSISFRICCILISACSALEGKRSMWIGSPVRVVSGINDCSADGFSSHTTHCNQRSNLPDVSELRNLPQFVPVLRHLLPLLPRKFFLVSALNLLLYLPVRL